MVFRENNIHEMYMKPAIIAFYLYCFSFVVSHIESLWPENSVVVSKEERERKAYSHLFT